LTEQLSRYNVYTQIFKTLNKFAPLVNLVQRYVSTKLQVSTAIVFRDNQSHGTHRRTDGRTRCNT